MPRYIYGTWFPNSNHERGEGPDLEVYDVCNSTPEALSARILIPLRQEAPGESNGCA